MVPKTITVNVTQEHIDRGTPEHCSLCPIALATLDAIDTVGRVMVDYDHIRLSWAAAPNAYYPLPPEAMAFIDDFDENEPVAPIAFQVTRQDTRL